MIINGPTIDARSSEKRGWNTTSSWASFSMPTLPWASYKFLPPNQLQIVTKSESWMWHSY